jgi:PAS domain S-box-containing protein
MAVLKTTRGADPRIVCELRAAPLLLGRNPQRCQIVLEHFAVSREHARLELIDGVWHIEDLDSRNGVMVNAKLIEPGVAGKRAIYFGDRIEIAAFELLYADEASSSDILYLSEETERPGIITTIACSSESSRKMRKPGRQSRLETLVGIIEDVSRELDFEQVLAKTMTSLFRVFEQAQSGCVLLPDDTGEYIPTAIQHTDGKEGPVRVSRTILAEAIENRQAVLSGDVARDARFLQSGSVRDLKLYSVMCVPLLDNDDRILGLIQLEVIDGHQCFTNDDLELLVAVARHLSIVMENARLYDRQLRQQRAEFETRFQTLVETSLQGILIHRGFKPLFVNEAWAALHEYTVREILRMESVLPLLAPEEREQAEANAAAGLRGEPVRSTYEAQHLRKDGSRIWFEKFTSVVDWDGEPAVQTAVIDRTKRREAEEGLRRAHDELERRIQERTEKLEDTTSELERSNRDLEQFAYSVSHDLQAPLRTITSYCQLLLKRYDRTLDGEADEFLHGAVDGSRRMKRLLDDLLTFSRVSTDTHPLRKAEFERVLDEVLRNLDVQIQESGAKIIRGPLPTVFCDATQLMQVLQNMIVNAIVYRNEAAPEINICAEEQPDEWLFRVKDNGVGIDRKQFERVFVIFQRLYAEHERPGSGVGLSICKRIIERHGGRIWVESEPGQGSTFYFTIPK